jgi:flagellar biosynthesis GTPase FlhF
MLRLAETDPETRRLLLIKSMSDLLNEKNVDVTPIANLDPKLRDAQINDDITVKDKNNSNKSADVNADLPSRQVSDERTNKQEFKTEEQNTLDRIENTLKTKEMDQVAIERENKSLDDQLNVLKEKQKDFNIEDSVDLQSSKKQSQEITSKQKEIKDAIIDGINCINKV